MASLIDVFRWGNRMYKSYQKSYARRGGVKFEMPRVFLFFPMGGQIAENCMKTKEFRKIAHYCFSRLLSLRQGRRGADILLEFEVGPITKQQENSRAWSK